MVILLESASMGDGQNSHSSAKVFINCFKIELLKKSILGILLVSFGHKQGTN